MQLQDLEIYRQLYELRSINAVAKALGFAQSNITARLKAIESEFDAQLFERSYQGIMPTQAGETFYQYALTVLQATSAVRSKLQSAPKHRQIVISELLFNELVIDQQRFDLTQNTFQVKSSTEIETVPVQDADQVITYAHFEQANYQCVAQSALTTAFLGQSDQLPILVNRDTRCPFRRRTLTVFSHEAERVMTVDSWAAITKLVATGRGIALLPVRLMTTLKVAAINQRRFEVPYWTYTRIG